MITAYILGEQLINESTRRNTPRRWLTATSDCQGDTPAQEPVPTVVVLVTDVVAGALVVGAVEVAGLLVVVAVVVVVTGPPPEPLVSASFTEISYLLLAGVPVSRFPFMIQIGCNKTRTVGLGHVPQHHTAK